MSASITWLCCPAGVVDGNVRLSVVALPRLAPDRESATIAEFGPLADWPTAVAATDLVLTFSGVEVRPRRLGDAPDSALWRALFPDTEVRGFGSGRDPLATPVVEVATGAAADLIRTAYATAAVEHPNGAAAGAVLAELFDVGPLEEFVVEQRRLLDEAVAAQAGQAVGTRVATPTRQADASVAGVIAAPRLQIGWEPREMEPLDLHQVLTLLGDHGWLRRRLGLVLDLEVPRDALADQPASAVRVADTSTLPNGVDHVLPWTGIDAAFVAPPREPGATPGLWPLDQGGYRLESLDVDAAATAGVARLASTSDTRSLPALRDDGISLVHAGRAGSLNSRMAALRDARSAGGRTEDTPLLAEDLVRGLRCDVLDETTRLFHSLHHRRVGYRIDGYGDLPGASGSVEEEGIFHEALAGEVATLVEDRVLTWRGWSLSAPPPGAAPRHDEGRSAAWLEALHTHLTITPAPGTLPRLRYGRSYRFRVRTVDAAGHRLPVDAAPAVTTEPLTFRRYQPVSPPVVAPIDPQAAYPPGETLTRLVAHGPIAVAFGALAPTSERWLLPPPATYDLAERHGMLDAALGNADVAGRAVARGLLGRFRADTTAPIDGVVPWLPDPQAVGLAFSGLPYTGPDQVVTVMFEGASWDQLAPVRLRVASVDELAWALVDLVQPFDPHPRYDVASRTLTVYLPQASVTRVRVSSVLRDPDLMALLHDIGATDPDAADPADRRTTAAARMRSAQHPMVTPAIELVLVHAALPNAPAFDGQPRLVRDPGETALGLQTSLSFHAAATDELVFRAAWDEERDHGPDGNPATVRRAAEICTWRPGVALLQDPARQTRELDTDSIPLPRLQLGTAGHRNVSLAIAATSSFADCFPPGGSPAQEGPAVGVQVLNAVTPVPPLVRTVAPSQGLAGPVVERVEDQLVVEEARPDAFPVGQTGWTRTGVSRTGGGIRVYLERPWFTSGSGELLGVVVADPAVAAPPIPGAPDNAWALDEANPVASWVSLAGQDPITISQGLEPLDAGSFWNVAYAGSLAALPQARAAGLELPVSVLGFAPEFERSSGLWFADIAVDAKATYRPFYRLAVVRYQPNSISEDTMVSPVVLVDAVQTLPNRWLTALRQGGDPAVRMTLSGPTYKVNDEDLRARVTCSVFVTGHRDDDHWIASGEPVDLAWLPEHASWSSMVSLPTPGDGERLRLLVVEHDRVPSLAVRAERVVFVGTIDL